MQDSLERELRHNHSAHGPFSELPELWAMRALGVRVGEVRPGEGLCALAPRPLLLVYGGADPVAPPALAGELASASCGAADVWIVPGGGHGGWDRVAPDELTSRLVGFFSRALLR